MPLRTLAYGCTALYVLAGFPSMAAADDGLKNCVTKKAGGTYLEQDANNAQRWNQKQDPETVEENWACLLSGGLGLTASAGVQNITNARQDRVTREDALRVRGSKETVKLEAAYKDKPVLAETAYSLHKLGIVGLPSEDGWFSTYFLDNVRLDASIAYDTIVDEELDAAGEIKNEFDKKLTYDVTIKYTIDVNELTGLLTR